MYFQINRRSAWTTNAQQNNKNNNKSSIELLNLNTSL